MNQLDAEARAYLRREIDRVKRERRDARLAEIERAKLAECPHPGKSPVVMFCKCARCEQHRRRTRDRARRLAAIPQPPASPRPSTPRRTEA